MGRTFEFIPGDKVLTQISPSEGTYKTRAFQCVIVYRAGLSEICFKSPWSNSIIEGKISEIIAGDN